MTDRPTVGIAYTQTACPVNLEARLRSHRSLGGYAPDIHRGHSGFSKIPARTCINGPRHRYHGRVMVPPFPPIVWREAARGMPFERSANRFSFSLGTTKMACMSVAYLAIAGKTCVASIARTCRIKK